MQNTGVTQQHKYPWRRDEIPRIIQRTTPRVVLQETPKETPRDYYLRSQYILMLFVLIKTTNGLRTVVVTTVTPLSTHLTIIMPGYSHALFRIIIDTFNMFFKHKHHEFIADDWKILVLLKECFKNIGVVVFNAQKKYDEFIPNRNSNPTTKLTPAITEQQIKSIRLVDMSEFVQKAFTFCENIAKEHTIPLFITVVGGIIAICAKSINSDKIKIEHISLFINQNMLNELIDIISDHSFLDMYALAQIISIRNITKEVEYINKKEDV